MALFSVWVHTRRALLFLCRRAWAHSPRAANHPKIVTIRALYRDPTAYERPTGIGIEISEYTLTVYASPARSKRRRFVSFRVALFSEWAHTWRALLFLRRRAWAHSPRAANHPKIVTIRALYRDPTAYERPAGIGIEISEYALTVYASPARSKRCRFVSTDGHWQKELSKEVSKKQFYPKAHPH